MYKYKIDVVKALSDRGYNSYRLKKSGILSQGTIVKLKNGGNVTLKTLNTVCIILHCQISDIIEIDVTDEEKIKFFKEST